MMESTNSTRREFLKTAAAAAVSVPALLAVPVVAKPALVVPDRPDWHRQLEAMIRETIEGEKWEKTGLVFASQPFLEGRQTSWGEMVRERTLEVEVPTRDYLCTDLHRYVCTVNEAEFCGADPETLLLNGFSLTRQYYDGACWAEVKARFTLRSHRWNDVWNPKSGHWVSDIANNGDAELLYRPADFWTI